MNDGESIQEAVVRELAEELDVPTLNVGEVLFSVFDELSGYEINFVATEISGAPRALEHSAITWCERDHLLNYALAPSDRAFANFIMGAA